MSALLPIGIANDIPADIPTTRFSVVPFSSSGRIGSTRIHLWIKSGGAQKQICWKSPVLQFSDGSLSLSISIYLASSYFLLLGLNANDMYEVDASFNLFSRL